jgi:hypothetical protein
MKFTYTKFALVAAVALSLMAATVLVPKKLSDYPVVTTPGENDFLYLILTNTPPTNHIVKYSAIKAAINATNVKGSGIIPLTVPYWSTEPNTLGSIPNGAPGYVLSINSGGALEFLPVGGAGETNYFDITIVTNNFFVSGKGNTLIITNQLILQQAAVTYATNVVLNFDTQAYKTLTATGNVTFATTNLGAGKSVTVKLFASGVAPTVSFPAWTFIGAAAPTSLATNKTAIFTITSFGTADTNCVAAYAAEL